MKKTISLILLILLIFIQGTVVYGLGEIKHDGVTYKCVGNKLIIVRIDPSIKTLDVQKKLLLETMNISLLPYHLELWKIAMLK